MKKQQAFTLIELLVAIAIISILILASVPLYEEFVSGARVKGAAENLYAFIVKVRSDSINTQATETLVFQAGSTWCFGATTTSTCDCSVSANCNLGQVSSSEYSNTTLSLTGIGSSMTINGTRGIASTTGTMTFTASDGDAVSVILNKMGYPRICSANVVGYQACS